MSGFFNDLCIYFDGLFDNHLKNYPTEDTVWQTNG